MHAYIVWDKAPTFFRVWTRMPVRINAYQLTPVVLFALASID